VVIDVDDDPLLSVTVVIDVNGLEFSLVSVGMNTLKSQQKSVLV
jgi:hypothetical protein